MFRKMLPLQVRLHEAIRLIGDTSKLTCADVGADLPAMSGYLRKRGGTWYTVATGARAAELAKRVLNSNVSEIQGQKLPFARQTFDVVVLFDVLDRIAKDEDLIEECHRVLKPDGRLVVIVRRVKRLSLLGAVRRILGVTPDKLGCARAGYTEPELFQILKHGFDVHHIRSFSKFFVELVDVIRQFVIKRSMLDEGEMTPGMLRLHTVLFPFYWTAFQLDLLLFFTRGNSLIAEAKRRAWRPRNTPVLVDGRSIGEAVLIRPRD